MASSPERSPVDPGSRPAEDPGSFDGPVAPRLILALIALGVPAAGVLSWSNPHFYNPMAPRLMISAVASVGLVGSFASERLRRAVRRLAFWLAAATTSWFLYVALQNALTSDDVIGLLPLVVGTTVLASGRGELGAFLVLVAGGLVAIGLLVEPRFPIPISLMLLVGIAASVGVATLSRRELTDGLAHAKQDLESRVAERTQALEHSLARLEEEVLQREVAQQEASRASQAKSEFLATMSHELRTPLNAIIGYGELMLEDPRLSDLDETSRDLTRLLRSGRHLLQMIDGVLALAQVESGRRRPASVEVDLASVVGAAAGPWLERPRGNAIRLEVPEGITLVTDPDWLGQIVDSLLSNAVKFTDDGLVTVRAERSGAEVRLVVSDTGIGIPRGAERRIFERFVQLDGSRTRRHDGAGLGLAIAAELASGLGGRIEVESTLGEGSVFRVVFTGV